jgi:hypothetical protein
MKVFKQELKITDVQFVTLYMDAEIICVQVQHGKPCIWYTTNAPRGIKVVRIYTHGTGHLMASNIKKYIGTYQLSEGDLVFHVFEGE